MSIGLNLAPKLSQEHFRLTPFSVMNAKLATQIPSESVSKLLQEYYPADTHGTADLCLFMDLFFYCLIILVHSQSEGVYYDMVVTCNMRRNELHLMQLSRVKIMFSLQLKHTNVVCKMRTVLKLYVLDVRETDVTSSYKENNGKMPGTKVLKNKTKNTDNNLDNILMQKH